MRRTLLDTAGLEVEGRTQELRDAVTSRGWKT